MMLTRNPRIVVIGSLNVDLTTFIDRMPEPCETIFGREFRLGFGGKGGNQAAAARLCGADVAMVARVGDDLFGPATVADLNAFGIDSSHVFTTPNVSTGVAPIFIDEAGQNRILVVKGANDLLTPGDVDHARSLIEAADVVILQLEVPLDTVYHALDVARSAGVISILNPAPAQILENRRAAAAAYLIPNEVEAPVLMGVDMDVDNVGSRSLRDSPFERIIVTLGSKGAFYASRSEAFHVPGIQVSAVDTSGAGDAFIGSFAYCLATGACVRDAIFRANIYAGLSVTKPGTRSSFPTRRDWVNAWV
ncbi:MAG TPA: ribokinase [Bryobacteraceae bacterium]|jgi:ribokinase|nr:ribokinase [Bryobacteraceae bacterium]